jgi:hypothetical protein
MRIRPLARSRRTILAPALVLALVLAAAPAAARPSLVFAVFAADSEQLGNALTLTESIRSFAGARREAPVWVYAPAALVADQATLVHELAARNAFVRTSEAPAAARRYPFAGKVFAAARAESAAAGRCNVLAWLDEDTVVLEEPREFRLPAQVNLGYRPVMHKRIGLLQDEPLDEFWGRVYETLGVPPASAFPMVTPADSQTIRAYFNAGLLVVRPERAILRRWAEAFPVLYGDTAIARMCRQDRVRALFLHQAALAGAILRDLKREEMQELSPAYNFPLFFKEMYGACREFDSISGVVTLRYDAYFLDPAPDWRERLKGPAKTVAWLGERLGRR